MTTTARPSPAPTPTPIPTAVARPVLLDSGAARTCPVKTQNRFRPGLREPARRLDPAVQSRRDAQAGRRNQLLDDWLARTPGALDLREAAAGGADGADALQALITGAPLVVGAVLPADPSGHRVGTPDALVRGPDRLDGRPAYYPVVIKGHHVITADPPPGTEAGRSQALRFGTLDNPSPTAGRELAGQRMKTGSRLGDFLQLAHYVRMLATARLDPPGIPWAGVIGSDDPTSIPGVDRPEPIIGWTDLAGPLPTFGRAEPDPRSFLERYDDEHWFRLAIADSARRQTGVGDSAPPLLVNPIVNAECATCPWWEMCRSQLDDDDLSLRIERGRLRPREIMTLRDLEVATVTALAEADLEPLVTDYLARLGDRPGAEIRLRTATRRAQMLLSGVEFARETSSPIDLPPAEIEIDFDLETATDGRIYLWGFLVSDGGGSPTCRQFARFDDLNDEGEIALAREALGWLRDRIGGPAPARVYHYSAFEVVKLQELARRSADPLLAWAAEYAEHEFVDLLEVAKTNYFGVSGLGLKAIARHAGFRWRDPDPGGLNSQGWFAEAVHGSPDQRPLARRRVLEYNEDDVIATSRLRGWLRAQ